MGLPPGPAAVHGVGEPEISGQGGVARAVVTQVVPGHADGPVRIDRDRGLERERAHPRQPAAGPGAAAVPRPEYADRARGGGGAVLERHIDGAVAGDRGAGERWLRELI